MVEVVRTDVLVIGGGLASLYGVLQLPDGWDVLVVDKASGAVSGSSPLAQGGIAVAVGPGDSPELHASDTLKAGAGACSGAAVELLTHQAPGDLDELVRLGCEFDRLPTGDWDLNLEGGQTVARSVHRDDATGREIMRVVVERARRRARRLAGRAERLLVEDGRCVGAVVATEGGTVHAVARGVLLAAGGCGALFDATTNVPGATGDAIAIGYEAGAEVADLEFVQFHPTVLRTGGLQRVLLTEALRGDGAIVVDEAGRRFLFDDDPRGELAPRDVVARAIARQGGAFLDARPIGAQLERRFPNVTAAARRAGFDLTAGPVPVSPAAHYALGGVTTDLQGRTTMPGLYAAGECAATAVHGANRMAGNSLAESVVFGRLAAVTLAAEAGKAPEDPEPVASRETGPGDDSGWARLRSAMTAGAGLLRSADSLRQARAIVDEIEATTPDQALRLGAVAAGLICASALERAESRGVHFRTDHPGAEPAWAGRHVALRKSG